METEDANGGFRTTTLSLPPETCQWIEESGGNAFLNELARRDAPRLGPRAGQSMAGRLYYRDPWFDQPTGDAFSNRRHKHELMALVVLNAHVEHLLDTLTNAGVTRDAVEPVMVALGEESDRAGWPSSRFLRELVAGLLDLLESTPAKE